MFIFFWVAETGSGSFQHDKWLKGTESKIIIQEKQQEQGIILSTRESPLEMSVPGWQMPYAVNVWKDN